MNSANKKPIHTKSAPITSHCSLAINMMSLGCCEKVHNQDWKTALNAFLSIQGYSSQHHNRRSTSFSTLQHRKFNTKISGGSKYVPLIYIEKVRNNEKFCYQKTEEGIDKRQIDG